MREKLIPTPATKKVKSLELSDEKLSIVFGFCLTLTIAAFILMFLNFCLQQSMLEGVVCLFLFFFMPYFMMGAVSSFFYNDHHVRQFLCALAIHKFRSKDEFSIFYFILLVISFAFVPVKKIAKEHLSMFCYAIEEYWSNFSLYEKRGVREFQYRYIARFWRGASEKTIKQRARELSCEGARYFS